MLDVLREGTRRANEVAEETLRRHAHAFRRAAPLRQLDPGGDYHYRSDGERHGWNPETIAALQHAATTGSRARYDEFARAANGDPARPTTVRALLDFAEREPVPLDEVEPV